ncbi:MAG: nitrate ABC transporter permease [Chloroflexi bacterium]|nr:nitrate ABC transporter permease [Chloroflexota bacterium]
MWEISCRIADVPKWLLPVPTDIVIELYQHWDLLLHHSFVTMYEILIGFSFSIVTGTLIGGFIVYSKTLEKTLYPIIISSQTIPIIAIAPILLVWFGYGLLPKVLVVGLIAFFPIAVNTIDGLKSIDEDIVKMMKTLGANKSQIFKKIQIPNSLPYIFTGLRIGMAASVIGAVISEWVGSSEGLGYLMIRSKPQFLTERVFAAIFLLSIIGFLLFLLVNYCEKKIVYWKTSSE